MQTTVGTVTYIDMLEEIRQIADDIVSDALTEKLVYNLEALDIEAHHLKFHIGLLHHDIVSILREGTLVVDTGQVIVGQLAHEAAAGILQRRNIQYNAVENRSSVFIHIPTAAFQYPDISAVSPAHPVFQLADTPPSHLLRRQFSDALLILLRYQSVKIAAGSLYEILLAVIAEHIPQLGGGNIYYPAILIVIIHIGTIGIAGYKAYLRLAFARVIHLLPKHLGTYHPICFLMMKISGDMDTGEACTLTGKPVIHPIHENQPMDYRHRLTIGSYDDCYQHTCLPVILTILVAAFHQLAGHDIAKLLPQAQLQALQTGIVTQRMGTEGDNITAGQLQHSTDMTLIVK